MSAVKRVLIGVILVAYGLMLIRHLSWAAGGSDSSGYLNEARLMAAGKAGRPIELLTTLHLGTEWGRVFTPLGFEPKGRDMVPTYPPGLPAHFALAATIGGWTRAPFLVLPLAALLCLALMFVLARQFGLTELESFGAAAILAACPVFIYMAGQAMSDVVATAWTLAAIVCALANAPAAAGAAFAISVCVRPSNLLIAIPLAFALRWRIRPMIIAALAALPFGVAFMIWNHMLFGSAMATGYGSVREMVQWGYARERLPHYSYWLMVQLTPLVFPCGLLARRALLWAWFLPLFVFYCFYGAYDAWWYTRFLLPAIPPLIVGFLLIIHHFPRALVAAMLVAVIFFGAQQTRRLDALVAEQDSIYPETVVWVERQLPRDAIVVSMQFSGAFLYYSGRQTVRWDFLDNDQFQLLRAYAGAANLHWYAVLAPFEWERFPGHLAGKWTPIGQRRDIMLLRLD